ncbi:hypothetical protein [Lachnotalea glycerini]|uniref:Uncharacterized protein n=1 Tax=Lachnotalea glycerini TaxID=1763509 RepID=A0A371JBW4_9FIRM|nr:hypothetical protein [Lachnotalea glycerini]RDY30156.1 hypothetical protein CG710_016080 [Lachnotalea glycerini]
MDSKIKKLYDMLYSPILTPYNLLDNAKLPNYSYVKYYKGNDGIIAEMECEMEDIGIRTFYYCFDQRDFLLRILMEFEGSKNIVFDRSDEVELAKKDYYNNKGELKKAN